MEKYLLTIEFRYSDVPTKDSDFTNKTKKITIGVFDDFDSAVIEGNKNLEIFEKHFKLNKNYNKKERFSKNGGCFGSKKTLISNLAYLQTPFTFYAKIDTLVYSDVEETTLTVLDATKRYSKYRKENYED